MVCCQTSVEGPFQGRIHALRDGSGSLCRSFGVDWFQNREESDGGKTPEKRKARYKSTRRAALAQNLGLIEEQSLGTRLKKDRATLKPSRVVKTAAKKIERKK